MTRRRAIRVLLSAAAALCLAACGAPRSFYSPPAGKTVWNFSDPADPLAASTGTARLSYRDPGNTGWGPKGTVFAPASALGLPPVNGIDAGVMAFPAAAPDQGYSVAHNSPPNGVYARDGMVSNYTVVMDVLLSTAAMPDGFWGLQQCGAGNDDDADMAVERRKDRPGGIGAAGVYHGAVTRGEWHRLAWAVQCALGSGGTGQISKFVDGRFAGGQYTPGNGGGCRWALGPVFGFFTDDSGETAPGYAASIMFTDRVLPLPEIAALGGPSGRGADVPGPAPARLPPQSARRVRIIAHRANTGSTPENTLTGIKQAFDLGADAVEVDVRFTADGVAVLMHDEDLGRTTNGSGPVWQEPLSGVKKLDAGSWFDPAFAGEKVPTLVEALRAAKGRGILFLDVKGLDMGARIRRALKAAGVGPEAVWLSQGNSLAVAEDYRKNVPGAPILWEGAPPKDLSKEFFDSLKARGITGFDIELSMLNKELVEAARANGMFVSVYTALSVKEMLLAIELGADAMETDYPAELDALLPPR